MTRKMATPNIFNDKNRKFDTSMISDEDKIRISNDLNNKVAMEMWMAFASTVSTNDPHFIIRSKYMMNLLNCPLDRYKKSRKYLSEKGYLIVNKYSNGEGKGFSYKYIVLKDPNMEMARLANEEGFICTKGPLVNWGENKFEPFELTDDRPDLRELDNEVAEMLSEIEAPIYTTVKISNDETGEYTIEQSETIDDLPEKREKVEELIEEGKKLIRFSKLQDRAKVEKSLFNFLLSQTVETLDKLLSYSKDEFHKLLKKLISIFQNNNIIYQFAYAIKVLINNAFNYTRFRTKEDSIKYEKTPVERLFTPTNFQQQAKEKMKAMNYDWELYC